MIKLRDSGFREIVVIFGTGGLRLLFAVVLAADSWTFWGTIGRLAALHKATFRGLFIGPHKARVSANNALLVDGHGHFFNPAFGRELQNERHEEH